VAVALAVDQLSLVEERDYAAAAFGEGELKGVGPLPDTSDSAFLQAFNDALEIRRLTAGLGTPQRQAIAAALPKELAAA
jgi:hypothetical protein